MTAKSCVIKPPWMRIYKNRDETVVQWHFCASTTALIESIE